MIFLSENSIRINAKKFGFKNVDIAVLESINNYLMNYTKNILKKALKKNKHNNIQIHQNGGRIVLPSEYFGIESGSYFENISHNNGTNMTVTNTMIRPMQHTVDLTGAIIGGSNKIFTISKNALKNALNEANVILEKNIKIDNDTYVHIKYKFEKIMTEIFRKASKKTTDNNLELSNLENIVNQSKYKELKA